MGCTIIDINPGAGLWSSKLHDFLKPRSHILIEPAQDQYLPFLQPFLDSPNSHYHLRDWDEETSWTPDRFFLEGLLGDEFRNCKAPSTQNKSLLINANLTHHRRKSTTLRYPPYHKCIKRLIDDFIFKTGFQAHGFVRVLMWLNDQDKQNVLPRAVCRRKLLALQVETTCHVEEVVGGANEVKDKEKKREDFLNIRSGVRAAEEMKRNNTRIPKERQDEIQMKVQDYLMNLNDEEVKSATDPQNVIVNKHRKWHEELKQLEKDFREGNSVKFINAPSSAQTGLETRKPRESSFIHSPEFIRLVQLQRNYRNERKNQAIMDDFFQQQAAIDALELEASNVGLDDLQRSRKLKEFTRLNAKLKFQLEQMTFKCQNTFRSYNNDRKAFALNPPLLMWDRRNAEPLVAREEEVVPTKEIALLDFQRNLSHLYPMNREQKTQWDRLMYFFFTLSSQTPHALNSFAPGAFDAIVPQAPALWDPFRGGRKDLSLLEARSFTPEMCHQITLALDRWEFKPSTTELPSH